QMVKSRVIRGNLRDSTPNHTVPPKHQKSNCHGSSRFKQLLASGLPVACMCFYFDFSIPLRIGFAGEYRTQITTEEANRHGNKRRVTEREDRVPDKQCCAFCRRENTRAN